MARSREKLTRRRFLWGAATLAAGSILAGCAPKAAPTQAPKPTTAQGQDTPQPAETQHSISFAWWGGGEAVNKVFEESVDRFELSHPNYKVNRMVMPYGEFPTKILIMYGSGNAPDCHGVPWGTVWSWAHRGVLLDLTPLVERDESQVQWRDDIWPAVRESCYYPARKNLIALPRETFGMLLVAYNKTLFEQFGVDTPDKTYDGGNWTWRRWGEDAKALTKFGSDGRRETMGTTYVGPEYMDLVMVMTSLGVSMFDEDLTHFNLDDPEVIVWLKQLNEMCAADRSLGSGEELSEFDWGASGRLGMTRDATFSILDWRQDWTDFEWDFVPCPKGSCCHTNIAGCDYHVVNGSNYADHEGGWEFIKFLNSPREDLWWATNMFGPPFRKSNLEAWAAKVSEILPKNGWRYLPDMAQGAEPWPTIPFSAEMNDIIWNELPQAIQGERAVEEVVESIVSKVDEVIAEYQQG